VCAATVSGYPAPSKVDQTKADKLDDSMLGMKILPDDKFIALLSP
jgi:hypothetical protein